jgi:hypothetical protein
MWRERMAKRTTASKLADFCARGIFTRDETILELIFESGHEEPAVMASDLPEDLIASLREYCAQPPRSPDEAPDIGGCTHEDFETWQRRQSRVWFVGVHRWHNYFQSAQ